MAGRFCPCVAGRRGNRDVQPVPRARSYLPQEHRGVADGFLQLMPLLTRAKDLHRSRTISSVFFAPWCSRQHFAVPGVDVVSRKRSS